MEKPKILPFVPSMKIAISKSAQILENQISIKATTNEKLGFIGREEGVAAYAVVMLSALPQ